MRKRYPKATFTRYGFSPIKQFIPVSLEEIQIAAWCPDERAKEPAEQVHLSFRVKGVTMPFAIRFLGPDTLAFLIEELARYRRHVWPEAEAVNTVLPGDLPSMN